MGPDRGPVRDLDRRGVRLLHGWTADRGLDPLVALVARAGDAIVALALPAAWLWPGPRPWRRRATVLASALSFALS